MTMTLADESIVIAVPEGEHLRLYSICETREQADAKIAAQPNYYGPAARVMAYAEFAQLDQAYWDGVLAQPPTRITEEQFDYALNVLPPDNFASGGGFTSFTMCEFQTGPYTNQYAAIRVGGETRYYQKLVDAFRRKTWMTYSGLAALEV